MGSFSTRHTFSTDVDTFWAKVFFDEEYNRRLYLEGLKFKNYEVLEFNREPGGVVTRKIRITPAADAPPVVTKLIGDSLSYVEVGRFDPVAKRWAFRVTPSKMADRVTTTGELWAEARGEKKCERVLSTEIRVKIFGVGSVVEAFVERTTRENYEKAAAFANRFIAEKGL